MSDVRRKKGHDIDKVMDAVDRFEDGVTDNSYHWSESVLLENIVSKLRDAVRHYEKKGDFGNYADLVDTVINGIPIHRQHMGYGTGIGFVLFDNIVSVIQDIAELALRPIIEIYRNILRKINKKYETSSEILASSLQLNDSGEASIAIEKTLPSNSDEQFIILRHPSKRKYTLEQAPTVSVGYRYGRKETLKVSFQGYRTFGYKVDKSEEINRISAEGIPLECFDVFWKDTLYPKK